MINIKAPDRPPTHQTRITIDATNASIVRPAAYTFINPLTEHLLNETTHVSIVEMAPINKTIPSIFTIDKRGTKPSLSKAMGDQQQDLPDLEVVQVTVPSIPKLGRDVNISLPSIPLDKLLPHGLPASDAGGLKTTVTLVNATLPSLNRIEKLNAPFFEPKNFTIGKKMGDGIDDEWGVQVKVEDVLTGGRGEVTPTLLGGNDSPNSLANVAKAAVISSVSDAISGREGRCATKCCAACKARPVKLEYAGVKALCPPGCLPGGNCPMIHRAC